ncbi:MAG: carbohydrate ABC transporter permease, partial [Gammaproteobacteria bacterium]|nr:carbohydrate ABC transporter permease [Gammaproteobacteria bacterium]
MPKRDRGPLRLLGIIMMLVFFGFALLPIVWALILSFRPASHLFEPIWQSPRMLTLENFNSLLRSNFPHALLNSLVTAGSSTLLAMLIGIPGGFALAKGRSQKRFISSWALLLLRMAPPVGFVIPLFLIYLNIGFLDTWIGLIAAYMVLTLPLVVWSSWTSLAQIPDELIEASLLDGASLFQALIKVVIPAARPGLIATGVLAFLIAWTLRASEDGRYMFGTGMHIVTYLFLSVTVGMFIGLTNSATEILRDRPTLRRERNCRYNNGLY